MIDSHCHLDSEQYQGRQDEIIRDALSAGVHTMVNIGADLESSMNSVDLTEKYDCIYATIGIHPHDAKTYDDGVERDLLRLLDRKKVIAVGEIGLDYYRDLSPRPIQKKVFCRQMEIAISRKLPVVIHSRESFRETVDVIKEYSGKIIGGVFHCFPGTVKDAFEVIELGFHISVGGVITFPGAKMATVAAEVPPDRILLETDCPYITPVPFRGKINKPSYVRFVRDKLAELRNISIEEVEMITDRNSRKVYRLVDIFEG